MADDRETALESRAAEGPLDSFLGSGRRGRWHVATILLLILVAALMLVLLFRFVAGRDTAYYTALIEQDDFVPVLAVRGTIHGSGETVLHASLDGVVSGVAVQQGVKITKGQVLATMDAEPLQASIEAGKALVAAAKAELATARSVQEEASGRLARFENVWRRSGHRVPALNELEAARAVARRAELDVGAATAKVEAARSRLEADRAKLATAVVRAPIDGYLVDSRARAGQRVRAGMRLFTIAPANARLEIEVPLAAQANPMPDKGALAQVRLDALPDGMQTARFDRVLAVPGGQTGSRRAVFVLTTPTPDVRPGMEATLQIELPKRANVLLVPDAALSFASSGVPDRSQDSIYLLADDGQPKRVYVTRGAGDGKRTEVFARDIRPGDEVITGLRNAADETPTQSKAE